MYITMVALIKVKHIKSIKLKQTLMESFKKIFEDSINLKKEILTSGNLNVLKEMGDEIVSSIKSGSKIYYVEMEDQQLTHNTLQLKC